MHRITTTLLAAALSLVAANAHADLFCPDARAQGSEGANYQWDELTGPTSRGLYLDLEACSCGTLTYAPYTAPLATPGPCSASCSFSDIYNDWGCGLTWPVSGPLDEYTWTQEQADACNACIADTCSAESLACNADGSP